MPGTTPPADFPIGDNPAFDFYFAADNVTVCTIDLNVTYPIETDASFSPYVGVGLNLVEGAEFEVGQLQPFVQGQITLGNLTRVGITGGLLFAL